MCMSSYFIICLQFYAGLYLSSNVKLDVPVYSGYH